MMTIGELRNIIAQLPDDARLRIIVEPANPNNKREYYEIEYDISVPMETGLTVTLGVNRKW